MTELVVNGLTFGYGSEPLLRDVSFTLDRPELVCVIGPNGVGKTTLVKCINKLLRPDSGSVTLDGDDVLEMRLMDLARKMAFVPNRMDSVFRVSVAEMVLMGRFPFAQWANSDRDLEVADRAMAVLNLQSLSHRDVSELSSGQLQKVLPVKDDAAAHHLAGGIGHQAHDAQGRGGLAGTGLAHQADALALFQGKGDVVYRPDGLFVRDVADLQVLDFQYILTHTALLFSLTSSAGDPGSPADRRPPRSARIPPP